MYKLTYFFLALTLVIGSCKTDTSNSANGSAPTFDQVSETEAIMSIIENETSCFYAITNAGRHILPIQTMLSRHGTMPTALLMLRLAGAKLMPDRRNILRITPCHRMVAATLR